MSYAFGIDLGGSSVKAVVVTREGKTLGKFNEPFDAERPMHFAETIRDLVKRAEAETLEFKLQLASLQGLAPDKLKLELQHIGLSAPGLAARNGRSIAFMPGRLHGLVGLVWSEYLETSFPIPVLNDAHAALLGEV